MPSTELNLPAFPLGGSSATLVRWLKRPGEPIVAGEPLAIVVNDRVELLLPAPIGGVLEQQMLGEGAVLLAGAPLATIAAVVAARSAEAAAAPADPAQLPRLRSTPVARRMAAALGLDLKGLSSCGVSGRVTKADVLAALAPGAAEPPTPALASSDFAPARAAPAALQPGPDTHALSAIEIDMSRVAEARARLSADFARRGLVLSDTTFVIWAAVGALPQHPQINGAWNESGMIIRRRVNLAVRSADRQTLIQDAQDLNLRGLARAIGSGRPAMPGDSTFTIALAGEGAWLGIPAAIERQGATLGIGAARPQPVVVAEHGRERIAVRAVLVLVLVYDARMFGQYYADAFLRNIKTRLEQSNGAAPGI